MSLFLFLCLVSCVFVWHFLPLLPPLVSIIAVTLVALKVTVSVNQAKWVCSAGVNYWWDNYLWRFPEQNRLIRIKLRPDENESCHSTDKVVSCLLVCEKVPCLWSTYCGQVVSPWCWTDTQNTTRPPSSMSTDSAATTWKSVRSQLDWVQSRTWTGSRYFCEVNKQSVRFLFSASIWTFNISSEHSAQITVRE